MQFSDIPGLNELKSQLVNTYTRGKVAHAQLFSGRSGTAALPMALAYAGFLMCQNKTKTESCGVCSNCVRIQKLIHPDIHLLFPKIATPKTGEKSKKYYKTLSETLPKFRSFIINQPFGDLRSWAETYGQENKNLLISREDSRYILKNVSMRSVEGGYKIIFIWCPELMNPSAANAILKILEEPPEKTIYLFISHNHDSLPATILSRTQLVVIPPNQEDELTEFLIKKGADRLTAEKAARDAEGRLGVAIQLMEEEDKQEYQTFQKWMLECWNKDFISLIRRSEDFSKSGKVSQRATLDHAISLVRSAVLYAAGQKPPVRNEEELLFISKYSDRLGFSRLEKICLMTNNAIAHIERYANPQITHFNLSLGIIEVLNG
ncbi:MAG: DNA polymerase III subunit delta [Ekhidna sp.]|nr:DNA polymerase III subunit delta [Ekhidna sp.]